MLLYFACVSGDSQGAGVDGSVLGRLGQHRAQQVSHRRVRHLLPALHDTVNIIVRDGRTVRSWQLHISDRMGGEQKLYRGKVKDKRGHKQWWGVGEGVMEGERDRDRDKVLTKSALLFLRPTILLPLTLLSLLVSGENILHPCVCAWTIYILS